MWGLPQVVPWLPQCSGFPAAFQPSPERLFPIALKWLEYRKYLLLPGIASLPQSPVPRLTCTSWYPMCTTDGHFSISLGTSSRNFTSLHWFCPLPCCLLRSFHLDSLGTVPPQMVHPPSIDTRSERQPRCWPLLSGFQSDSIRRDSIPRPLTSQ